MLELQFIRDHKDLLLEGLGKRGFDAAEYVDQIIELDQKRRSQQTTLDQQLARANTLAKEIGSSFKKGETDKASALKEESLALKEQTKALQEALQHTTAQLFELRTQVPNLPHTSVPAGSSEADNEEIFQSGTIPDLGADPLPHWELAKKYDLIDFELGNKITGAGFPVYKGKGARLQRALINYFLDKNTQAGYKEIQVPHVVNEASGFGTGQLPDKEGQMYHIQADDLYLIPTAEVPLTNLYRATLLEEKEVEHVKTIINELELPYRILRLCGGDLGFTSALTYDFEIYSTAQQRWLEISSVSTFNSFQAERLQLRYKTKEGKKQNVHTLNGSALALPRVLAGMLENFQTAEGIKIPKALVPYTGFDKIF
ncbi:MAG: serine--tRNA ligase [Flavobacteriia bacterium]|nr:serine--tRNA ligase [Flavobacteriia bacterium]